MSSRLVADRASITPSNVQSAEFSCRLQRSCFDGAKRSVRRFFALFGVLLVGEALALAQISVFTQHYDNARSGQNTNESILTHANVNPVQFGKLFAQPLDGKEAGQPLYVPGVYIPANAATHNVIYVATQHDSVYAFDADDNRGGNSVPLWQVNFLNPAAGVTTVPVADIVCRVTGFTEFGIVSTPVIDPTRHAIYVLAMTKENGAYVHKLHALDLGTGAELFGGPVQISASVNIAGNTYNFIDKYQMQRPALLLQNGVIFIAFGSAGCNNGTEMGWVMAYDAATLNQVGVFDDSPGKGTSAIWMGGAGPAGDGSGNVFFSTGDGFFDADLGGTHFGDSVIKLTKNAFGLSVADYFTPSNQLYLRSQDDDLGSGQVMLLPNQGAGNFALAVGKNGVMYLLDQNNLGQFNPVDDSQIVQEVSAPTLGDVYAGLTYWNNTIYLEATGTPVLAYSFSSSRISGPIFQSAFTLTPRGGIVSSNGTRDGIFWCISPAAKKLYAFDATDLNRLLYSNPLSRDPLGAMVHFAMPIVANGRVYVNGATELAVFGLRPLLATTAGNNQSGAGGTTLTVPLRVTLTDAYTHNPEAISGVPVTFSDGNLGGTFSNPNAVTDASGSASTTYTLPTKASTYALTASNSSYVSASFIATSLPGPAASFTIAGGNGQSGIVATSLPSPLKVALKDSFGNGISGAAVSFTDGGAGGTLSPPSSVTDSSGFANTLYTTPTKSGKVVITASTAGMASLVFNENAKPGPPVSLAIYAGDGQTVAAGKTAAKMLQVIVKDQYGNGVPGVSVTYDDAGVGGSFSVNPAVTAAGGIAGTRYTVTTRVGNYSVHATGAGLGAVAFAVNVKSGPAASLRIVSGNNQAAAAGTALPNPLVVGVQDQYGNPVSKISVNFSDGGAGGILSPTSGASNLSGQVSTTYTTPRTPGSIVISGTSTGLTPVSFSETAN